MAKKTNTLKAPPEDRETAATGDRRPMPPLAALNLARLRPILVKVPPPRARLQIAIQIEEPTEEPRVVKIIHVDSI